MKINDIYNLVKRILNRNEVDTDDESFSERAPYLAAIFCCNAAALDRDFRESRKLPSQQSFNEVYLKMEDDFPLDSRFSVAAAYYVSAMLLLEENEALSDKLFAAFSNSISTISGEIPFKKGKTVNAYP